MKKRQPVKDFAELVMSSADLVLAPA